MIAVFIKKVKKGRYKVEINEFYQDGKIEQDFKNKHPDYNSNDLAKKSKNHTPNQDSIKAEIYQGQIKMRSSDSILT